MIKILNEFTEYNLNLDSKPSDMTDGLDFVAFILDCEKYYNFEINDDEAIFIETENLTFIYNLIVKNINELKSNRPDYEKYIINHRDNKLNDLLN
jgi:acyl carrier protein